jgi:hypothetical protein
LDDLAAVFDHTRAGGDPKNADGSTMVTLAAEGSLAAGAGDDEQAEAIDWVTKKQKAGARRARRASS